MKTAKEVSDLINQWKSEGQSKSQIVVNAANACIGWPYVYACRGEECTPSERRSRASAEYPDITGKCQALNGQASGCSGCQWYPGGTVRCFDCRGFTYWLMKQVGITINGKGATSQYDDNSNWSEKGEIANMPRNKVCCVFRHDSGTGKMEHTLLYDGNGSYIHCSGEVKKVATGKYNATHYAIPKGLDGGVEPVPTPTQDIAVVYAENGKPVKMRAKPSTSCKTYWELPVGTEVTVLQNGSEWTKITDGNHTGYMMTKFLKFNEGSGSSGDDDDGIPGEVPPADLCSVIIHNITTAQARELMAKYPDSEIIAG